MCGESSGLEMSGCGGMDVAVDSMRTCFFVLGGGETAWACTVSPLLFYCQEHAETQSNGLPSSSWGPAPGLLLSGVMRAVRGTGEEGAWLKARDARKGFPEDMLVVIDNALLYVQ